MANVLDLPDRDLYKLLKKKLPSQKRQMKVYKSQLGRVIDIIEEGRQEFKQGIMTEFEYAGFLRESKKLLSDIKLDISKFKEHIDIVEDFIYLYEEHCLFLYRNNE